MNTKEISTTHEIIRASFNYDEGTGLLTWALNTGSRAKIGCRAGLKSEKGYRHVGLNGFRFLEHRVIFNWMTGEWPKDQMDHINRDRSDNRWVNLRECSNIENCSNSNVSKTNKSGLIGVFWHKNRMKWMVQLNRGGRDCYIGCTESLETAKIIRDAWLEGYMGVAPQKSPA